MRRVHLQTYILKFHVYLSRILDLPPPLRGVLSHLPGAASTGLAFEPPLLVPDGPTAAPNPGETSCLACETPRPAAKTQRQTRHVDLNEKKERSLSGQAAPFDALLLAAAG